MAKYPVWVKRILIVLGVTSAIGIIFAFSFRFWIQPVVDQAIKLGLSQLREQGYYVDYQKLIFHPLRREIALEGVSIVIDTTQNDQKEHLSGKLDRLDIKLNRYPYWETDRFLSIQEISLQRPTIWLYPSDSSEETTQETASLDYYKLIQPFLDSLLVTRVRVEDGVLKQVTQQGKANDTLEIAGINIHLEKLFIDSLQSSKNLGLPSLSSLIISVDSLLEISTDSLYTFSVAKTSINVLDSTINLNDIRVQPNFSKREWRKHLDKRKDRLQAHIARVQIMGIRPSHWFSAHQLLVERINLDSATLEIYKDKRLQRSDRLRPLLSSLFQSVPFQFKVDTVALSDSEIVYEEQNTESARVGKISFNRFYASLYNTTNIVSAGDTFEANVQANLMNSGHFNLSVQVPLNRADGYHRVVGELDQMHLIRMNAFLEPVAFASVRSGILNKLSFEMTIDDYASEGKIHCIYNDLKISLLNPDDPQNPAVRELLGTWLVNWFVVKADNPTRNQPLRIGTIYLERDPSQSVFSYWSHSLLSGLKESVGLAKPSETTASAEVLSKEDEDQPGLLKRIFKKQ
ncbi:MAG: hypothetical protein WBA23_09895 [Tunicatimonas sp.]|uniref:hypothetical protein n=1 Tax=Tunicatimonas sp. TaxID=1940096 RepID=UPI003C74CB41